ncbi:16S rRNA (guanine(966)-N(2))-methyltransferase RsmD [uncultured Nocardioides sp.]|jgi:16S rRNA (guanine966-N2)-methyltransferase|uniref:16S rRNA (guanine(966)-N(2))-methyltransferase RsmD n=1 Tax=uncultured Nocardioides sp. TaxID=198441 RepID=UPI000C5DF0C4|nr:16S rRNA (guanine(966)-N(2))-methyltransferase RsmD [uncultured Nocardioides sp.]MAO79871.1 16S rRNA (guanine(966)-N(2))-methyltransferase RsmD [Nocardioides sp.]
MTRIIGGSAGGRRLETPRGEATRPTSDRVREALFSAVESWCGTLSGLRVLDLYAGSGALGLEACSRGADHALLVERDRRTAAVITANARTLGLPGARVVAASVGTVLASAPDRPYDLVLADPPYPLPAEEVDADLEALVAHGWLAGDALVVVERGRRSPEPSWPVGFTAQRRRKYGETTLWSAEWPGPPIQPEE